MHAALMVVCAASVATAVYALQDLQEDAEFGSLLQPGEGGAADGAAAAAAAAAANDADKRSVYVGNVRPVQ